MLENDFILKFLSVGVVHHNYGRGKTETEM